MPTASRGRVAVEPTLQVPGHPEVYVIGDLAYFEQDGEMLPMVAQVALQGGVTAARNIERQLAGQDDLERLLVLIKWARHYIFREHAACRILPSELPPRSDSIGQGESPG